MTDTPREVLVLGGGYAGVLAASRVAGRMGPEARVTLVTERDELVHRVRLHEALAGRDFPRLPLRELLPPEVRVRLGRVRGVSTAAKTVTVAGEDGEDGEETLRYDAMICALGSRVDLGAPGAREHAGALASLDAALAAAGKLRALPPGAAVAVAGGGLTAVEVAAEVAEAHPALRVTLLAAELAPGLSARGRDYVRATLAGLGVDVREGVAVASVDAGGVTLEDGARVASSLTVWAAGFSAAAPAVEADWRLDARGRVAVGADLAARGADGVFVAGDAAAAAPGLEAMLRMGCVTAMPMGAHAADNVARVLRGRAPRPFEYGFPGQCVSLGRRRGVVQFTDARDRPLDRVVTGRAGAAVKELVCRFVIGALRMEASMPGLYQWRRTVPAGGGALAAEAGRAS